jgi:hypothetical protein|tara:strand:- start:14 stop:1174 length:1161 start_codon:yes stop_codon:yes gene_type:complete
MPTINQLPTITTLSGGDQLPVYATSNGDARKASINTLVEYFQTTFADPNYTVVINAPTNSGFNIALAASSQSIWLIMNPAGTFAAGSVTLPPVLNCYDGQEIIIISTLTISALTINGNGGTLVGVPASLGAGSSFTIRFNELQQTWYTIVNSLQISGVDLVTTTGVQTLTNKTINLADNTLIMTSAQLATALLDETGSGLAVFNTSPTLVTPILGTPTSGTLTNCTGLPTSGLTGLGVGVQTFLGTPSSANLATALTDETGTGSAVFNTDPTIDGANFTGHAQTAPVVGASTGGTLTLDMSQSNVFTVSMTENVTTVTLGTLAQGQTVNILFTQDATGNRTIIWPADFKWPGGTAETLSTNSNAVDLLVITYLGTNWYASMLKDLS